MSGASIRFRPAFGIEGAGRKARERFVNLPPFARNRLDFAAAQRAHEARKSSMHKRLGHVFALQPDKITRSVVRTIVLRLREDGWQLVGHEPEHCLHELTERPDERDAAD